MSFLSDDERKEKASKIVELLEQHDLFLLHDHYLDRWFFTIQDKNKTDLFTAHHIDIGHVIDRTLDFLEKFTDSPTTDLTIGESIASPHFVL